MSERILTGLLNQSAEFGANFGKRTAPARILEYAPDRYLALPIHTTLEIVETPEILPIPGIAAYGVGLFEWQGKWIPVVDLSHLLHGTPTPDADKPKYALSLAYQCVPGEPLEYAAVILPSLPETTFVDDWLFCDLPDDSPLWPSISLSCFTYREKATPIVDTGRLFGRSYE